MTPGERLALSVIFYPGSNAAAILARLPFAFDLRHGDLPAAIRQKIRAEWAAAERQALAIEEDCAARGIEYVFPGDALYPPTLFELVSPPLVLYLSGDTSVLSRPGVAIVGTRRATPCGLSLAEHIACLALSAGYTVLSGGAEGIDSAAHEGALAATERGSTIAVLGGGLARLPSARSGFFKRIRAHGLLVSEYAPRVPARFFHFIRRNSILAALSAHLFVVQAPKKSGTLITAAWAKNLGRGITVCLWPPDLAEGAGCRQLYGADVLYTADGSGFLDGQNIAYTSLADIFARAGESAAIGADERKVIFTLLAGERGLAEIVHACGLTAEKALAALTHLEMAGWVRSSADGRYFFSQAA
jgi:DNA processing protein